MIDFFINIKNFILSALLGLTKFIKYILRLVPNYFQQIVDIKTKLQNLEAVNFDLVDYHLDNGNLSDAIMRLKIIDKFIAPNNIVAQYKLAWCYFIKADFTNSLFYLAKSQSVDSYGLQKYLLSQDIQQIPEAILAQYKNIAPGTDQKFYDGKNTIINKAISMLAKQLKTIPHECQILDIGVGDGMVGKVLNQKLPKKYILTGIESSHKLCQKLQDYKLYDDLQNIFITDFLKKNTVLYDVVISFCSVLFNANLSINLTSISKLLKPNRYFIFVFINNQINKIDDTKTRFLYNTETVTQEITHCRFNMLEISEFLIDKTNYVTLLCQLM